MTKKCQVIFFPMLYIPDTREEARRQHVQDMFTSSHQEFRHRAQNEYELKVMMQAFHDRVRKHLEVIDGGLELDGES